MFGTYFVLTEGFIIIVLQQQWSINSIKSCIVTTLFLIADLQIFIIWTFTYSKVVKQFLVFLYCVGFLLFFVFIIFVIRLGSFCYLLLFLFTRVCNQFIFIFRCLLVLLVSSYCVFVALLSFFCYFVVLLVFLVSFCFLFFVYFIDSYANLVSFSFVGFIL